MIAMVSIGPVRARGSEVQRAKVGMGVFPEEARKFGGPNTQSHTGHLQDFGLGPESSPLLVGLPQKQTSTIQWQVP